MISPIIARMDGSAAVGPLREEEPSPEQAPYPQQQMQAELRPPHEPPLPQHLRRMTIPLPLLACCSLLQASNPPGGQTPSAEANTTAEPGAALRTLRMGRRQQRGLLLLYR